MQSFWTWGKRSPNYTDFIRGGQRWSRTVQEVDRDFKAYLKSGKIPFYVRDILRLDSMK
jgi:hypothetical protein